MAALLFISLITINSIVLQRVFIVEILQGGQRVGSFYNRITALVQNTHLMNTPSRVKTKLSPNINWYPFIDFGRMVSQIGFLGKRYGGQNKIALH